MSEVIWHDVECGGYEADLALWEELATETPAEASIMELGCGSGRVALHLVRRCARYVVGLDASPELVAVVSEKLEGLPGGAKLADAREFDLPAEFGLVLAPMQLIQLLADSDQRAACLSCVASHLASGGRAAFAIVEEVPGPTADDALPPLPDVRELQGWIYSSLPLEPRRDGDAVVLRRLRQTVSPRGDLSEELNEVELQLISADGLEREAAEAALRPAGRRTIAATEAHAGSTVVLLEKGA